MGAESVSGHAGSLINILGIEPLWLATGLLLLTYAAVMSERMNRAVVALLGAGLMVSLGVLNQEAAIRGIDFNTIALLVGMMLIVAVTRQTGVFQYVAIQAVRAARANPAGILILLSVVTAVFSALLDNVTTVLLVAPVTLVIAKDLEVSAYPYLVSEIFASNIGGTATLIGDPPNIIIGSAAGLTFNDFVLELTPIILVILAMQLLFVHLVWGRKLTATPEARARVLAMDAKAAIEDPALLRRSLAVLALVIGGFVSAHHIGLEPGTIGLFGAAVLMMLDNLARRPDMQTQRVVETFNEVEWITIFFFVGLFVVVAGVEHAGLLKLLAAKLLEATAGNMAHTAIAILWASAILSAVVDNIPFVATMIPLIKSLAPSFGGPENLLPLWWALSLGACLGGNGSLVGASANLTVAGIAEREGVHIRFIPFLKQALPLMLLSIVLANAYLWYRHFS